MNQGIFDYDDTRNPVKDWNIVFVPYCTGDIHAGTKTNAIVAEVPENQQFVGYLNIGHYLERIIPTFQDVTHVLLAGDSAGGYGVSFNYDRVAQAFGSIKVILLNDSGPLFRDDYLGHCIQKIWRDTWDLNSILPSNCIDCNIQSDGGGLYQLYPFLFNEYPVRNFGLISSEQDADIQFYFGFGEENCSNPYSYTGIKFQNGLYDLKNNVLDGNGWRTFILPGDEHTWLSTRLYNTYSVDNVLLTDWLDELLNQ